MARYPEDIRIFLEKLIGFAIGKLRAPSLALDWQINRLIEVEARVSYHAGRWYSMLPRLFLWLTNYRAVLAWGPLAPSQ